jgi:hypothetical protein
MKLLRIVYIVPLAFPAIAIYAQAPAQLALNAQIQYSTVIQGGQDPVYAFVYNLAPAASAAGNYRVSGNQSYLSPVAYSGSKSADGGKSSLTLDFNFDSSQVAPGNNVPISLTLTDTSSKATVTEGGTVNVLAHAAPGLVLSGNIVPLTVRNNVKFTTTPAQNSSVPIDQTNAFPPQEAGAEAPAGGFAPQMIGDPPGEPTAELDLDSITTSGDPQVAINELSLFDDLPSTDSATENDVPFWVELFTDVPGAYTDTFTLHYSDEQDLPGADAPDSEETSFSVTATLDSSDTIQWDVSTDVPEPATASIFFLGGIAILKRRCRHRGSCRPSTTAPSSAQTGRSAWWLTEHKPLPAQD